MDLKLVPDSPPLNNAFRPELNAEGATYQANYELQAKEADPDR
jgi:hypothetical protein